MAEFTPYSTAVPYFSALPQWARADDAQRIASYQLYEEMYWGSPDAFKLSQKGSDESPIYVPAARAIIEATHRFLATDWSFSVEGGESDEERALARAAFLRLFRRENMWSKFTTQKRYGLIRGDAMFHITADANKQAGSRISIHELDPASYFPIYDVENLDRIVGCHLIEFVSLDSKEYIRRQTYRKVLDENGTPTGTITTELSLFELAGWDDRYGAKPEDIKQVEVIMPPTPLPPQITQLPVYHWKNTRNPADPFGSSLIRGLERLAAAINQTITDQDLSVALAGLGVYATDSGAPVDEDGNETDWVIGPGRVVEVSPGSKWNRVPGITTVDPGINHASYLEDKMREGAGVPGLAVGDVDVATAESGVALSIRLAPLLSANAERELEILGVTDQMLYDIQTMWFPAYEGLTFGPTIIVTSIVGDPIPVNRKAVIDEILALATATPPLITLEMAQAELAKMGYEFPDDATSALVRQSARIALANDPFAGRVSDELAMDGTGA